MNGGLKMLRLSHILRMRLVQWRPQVGFLKQNAEAESYIGNGSSVIETKGWLS